MTVLLVLTLSVLSRQQYTVKRRLECRDRAASVVCMVVCLCDVCECESSEIFFNLHMIHLLMISIDVFTSFLAIAPVCLSLHSVALRCASGRCQVRFSGIIYGQTASCHTPHGTELGALSMRWDVRPCTMSQCLSPG
jgi:hypothetical protein